MHDPTAGEVDVWIAGRLADDDLVVSARVPARVFDADDEVLRRWVRVVTGHFQTQLTGWARHHREGQRFLGDEDPDTGVPNDDALGEGEARDLIRLVAASATQTEQE